MEYVRKLRREVIRKDGLFIADPGRIGIAVHDAKSGSTEYYFTQKVEGSYHGTGDCFAAVLTGGVMQGLSPLEAASLAADFVVESIRKTRPDREHFYGVRFEKALPMLTQRINR